MLKKLLALTFGLIILLSGYIYGKFDIHGNSSGRKPAAEILPVEAPEQLIKMKSEGLAPDKFIYALVTKTVDGDTLDIKYKNKVYKVRLLDVDTPESVKHGVAVQAYSKEASEFLKKSVLGKKVKLIFEKGLKDRYGRLLAHVIAGDNKYINSMLVRNGYARVEIVSPNKTFSQYFYRLQEAAIHDKLGLWGLPAGEQPFVRNKKGMYIPRYLYKEKAS